MIQKRSEERVGMVGVLLVLLIGSVGVLAFIALSFRRLMEELPSIRKQWREIYAQKRDAIETWNRWGCLVQFLYMILLALLLLSGQFMALVVFIVLLLLAVPLLFIVEGLKTLKLGYADIPPVFRPVHFVTGSGAIRRGKIQVAIGLLLLIPWLWFVLGIPNWLELL
jgi:hypothetical protein